MEVNSSVKEVVFRTNKLLENKLFFETKAGFVITECSYEHFVLQSEGIRIVFMDSTKPLEVDLYVQVKQDELETLQAPNGMRIKMNNFKKQ